MNYIKSFLHYILWRIAIVKIGDQGEFCVRKLSREERETFPNAQFAFFLAYDIRGAVGEWHLARIRERDGSLIDLTAFGHQALANPNPFWVLNRYWKHA